MEKVRASPSGSLALGVKLYADPAMTVVAGSPPMVGGASVGAADTVTVNAGSEVVRVPLLTLIVMFA